jgi:hypothetical protein
MFKLKYFLSIEVVLIVVAAIGWTNPESLKSLFSALFCPDPCLPGVPCLAYAYPSCSAVLGKLLFLVASGLAVLYLLGFIISKITKRTRSARF